MANADGGQEGSVKEDGTTPMCKVSFEGPLRSADSTEEGVARRAICEGMLSDISALKVSPARRKKEPPSLLESSLIARSPPETYLAAARLPDEFRRQRCWSQSPTSAGHSWPLTPKGDSPLLTYQSRDVGPLDSFMLEGGSEYDSTVVYTRLQNFAQRRRRLHPRERFAASVALDASVIEPITPSPWTSMQHGGYYDFEDMDVPFSRSASPSAAAASAMPCSPEATSDVEDLSPAGTSSIEATLLVSPPRPRQLERAVTYGGSVDELQPSPDEEAQEADRLKTIMRHLEEMNTAAADLNTVQESMKRCLQERQQLVQMWAVGSARIARAVGANQLAKARPFYKCQAECLALQKQVEIASQEILSVNASGQSSQDSRALTEKHASCVKEFLAAKSRLDKVSKKHKNSTITAKPYFDAETAHYAQLEEADATVAHLEESVSTAKARYRKALRDLEDLSDQTHQMRGNIPAPSETSPPREKAVSADSGISGISPPFLPASCRRHTATSLSSMSPTSGGRRPSFDSNASSRGQDSMVSHSSCSSNGKAESHSQQNLQTEDDIDDRNGVWTGAADLDEPEAANADAKVVADCGTATPETDLN